MNATQLIAAGLAALTLAVSPAQAGGRHGGVHGGAHHHHGYRGLVWGLGIGIGLGLAHRYHQDDRAAGYYVGPPPWAPAYVVTPPAPVYAPPPVPGPPDPVFYPRNGQSAAQIEADRRECNRWATTQQNAMNDASVFHRATLACMDGRGYSVR